jgi:2-polyprenyl-3-methyl-5-hydroxy-6-metoxy-1,4-benzoquinol methylase
MNKIDFYQELATYVGRNVDIVTAYCRASPTILAWEWEKEKADPIKYYKESNNYIFDLTFYADILQGQGFFNWIESVLKDFKIKTMLDFGGGCGYYTTMATKLGVKSDYVDVEGSKTEEYAKYRFKRDGIAPGILKLGDPLKDYDLIIAMDVFEHIADNKPIIADVAKHCKYLICNEMAEMPYNFMYPQHISTIELEPYFEHISFRLWKSKIKK